MTITVDPANGAEPVKDAGWNACVAEFKASSKIGNEARVCMRN